tara:strand:+ start:142 stop:1059 length:918 start_codon:yes stop_codon:yes gene_type:complete
MKLIITGGSGFIGRNIIRHLALKGHDIILLTHRSKPLGIEDIKCKILKCDISNFKTLEKISIKGIDALIHLAAQSSGPKSFKDPEMDIKTNILGTLNMIKWSKINKINRILFASSFTVYGDVKGKGILSEDELCNPNSIYGLSKYTCEQLLKIYAVPLGINYNIIRMFNVYGPDQDLNGKDDGMVNIFIKHIQNNNFIPIKGSLKRFRDFIYIEDVVKGWECCLNNDKNPNKIYNLGYGKKIYIHELIKTLIKTFGKNKDIKIKEISSTQGDIIGGYANMSKFYNDFNFKPKFSLKDGIKKMAKH